MLVALEFSGLWSRYFPDASVSSITYSVGWVRLPILCIDLLVCMTDPLSTSVIVPEPCIVLRS